MVPALPWQPPGRGCGRPRGEGRCPGHPSGSAPTARRIPGSCSGGAPRGHAGRPPPHHPGRARRTHLSSPGRSGAAQGRAGWSGAGAGAPRCSGRAEPSRAGRCRAGAGRAASAASREPHKASGAGRAGGACRREGRRRGEPGAGAAKNRPPPLREPRRGPGCERGRSGRELRGGGPAGLCAGGGREGGRRLCLLSPLREWGGRCGRDAGTAGRLARPCLLRSCCCCPGEPFPRGRTPRRRYQR